MENQHVNVIDDRLGLRYPSLSVVLAQRKIPVVLSFPYHRHKAGIASPLGVARAACFEQLAGVFASCGALHYAKISASLKTKMYTYYIIEQRPERLYFPFERIFESISRMIVKVGFNGKSRMLCLSIGTAVYMDMTACRPENPQKALLCSPPVRFFAGEEHA